MPTVDLPNGVVIPRAVGEALSAGVGAARNEFGVGVTNPANTIREIVEAIGALPWDAREQDILDLALQFDPRVSLGQFLEAALWPLYKKRPASKAAGIVNLNYNRVVTSPDPVFAAGDLEFIDGAGIRYTGTDDLGPPTTIHDTSLQSGTASETIGSGNTKIAQKVSIVDGDFPQAVRISQANVLTGTPVASVRIETDSAGSPSGVLAHSRLTVSAVALVDGGDTDAVFEKGAKVSTGDYWVVITVTGGTATFDGGTGGEANQVKFYNGSTWAVSAIPVENLNLRLYNGGEFAVVSTVLGTVGNIEVNAIGSLRTNSGAAQTQFDLVVDTFENLEAFEGGRDLETDEELRSRARKGSSARGTSSPGGIVTGMLDGTVDGVTFVDLLENDTLDWGQDQTVLDNSGFSGTNSESIDGATYTKIAQRFTVDDYTSVAAIAVKLGVNNSAEMNLRIETDNAGEPSGTLAAPNLEALDVIPSATNRTLFTLLKGDFLPAGTYWLVSERAAGDYRFTGTGAGATDNVKIFNGTSWALSATVEDIDVEIYGGLPPKSFELFVEGGSDNDVAQGIYGLRAPGILAYGPASGIALDVANREVIQRFARPTNMDIVFDVAITVTPEFAGDADTIRDLITEYVAELGIQEDLIRQEAMGRIITGDPRTIGVQDITLFRLGKKDDFPTPGDLTGAEVVNLTDGFGERFRVANPAVDIDVTITPA